MSGPISAAEAARRILAEIPRQPALRMPLDDALDGVLAEDVVSPIDIPAWTNSAMDGYAVRGEDVVGAGAERPVRLRVVEQIPAGAFPSRRIGPGEASRIFTGAPVPDGADSVIRQEDTDEGRETVTIVKDRDVGVNLRQAGEDIRREYVGYVEALFNEVEVAPGVVGLERRFVGPEPGAVRRHRFWHRDESDGECDERARQRGERSSALWCPGESAAAVAQFDRGQLRSRAWPDRLDERVDC